MTMETVMCGCNRFAGTGLPPTVNAVCPDELPFQQAIAFSPRKGRETDEGATKKGARRGCDPFEVLILAGRVRPLPDSRLIARWH